MTEQVTISISKVAAILEIQKLLLVLSLAIWSRTGLSMTLSGQEVLDHFTLNAYSKVGLFKSLNE